MKIKPILQHIFDFFRIFLLLDKVIYLIEHIHPFLLNHLFFLLKQLYLNLYQVYSLEKYDSTSIYEMYEKSVGEVITYDKDGNSIFDAEEMSAFKQDLENYINL